MMTSKRLFLAAAAVVPLAVFAAGSELVAYPEGYRDWTHAKSMVIEADHPLADPFEGIHHTYANARALTGLQSGDWQAGAVLVLDLLNVNATDNTVQEAERKFIGVMEYDAERFAETGGWGFEVFAGNSTTERVVEDGGTSCFGCHIAAKGTDYVFTRYRD